MIAGDWLKPDWPAPANVKALVTTRDGGVSGGPYASLNLGLHVGDAPAAVERNRALLRARLPAEPRWLDQLHGTDVADAREAGPVRADASVATRPGTVCAVMTADCLPVLFCNDRGTVVAAAHAGWRGLAAGVLDATVARMGERPENLLAWLGPAIGPRAFEVGDDVRDCFVEEDPLAAAAFKPTGAPGKWRGDLFMLARLRLRELGIARTYGGEICTYFSPDRFFSYRRDGTTGRFASVVWLSE